MVAAIARTISDVFSAALKKLSLPRPPTEQALFASRIRVQGTSTVAGRATSRRLPGSLLILLECAQGREGYSEGKIREQENRVPHTFGTPTHLSPRVPEALGRGAAGASLLGSGALSGV
jgi:hypothetical protein